MTKRCGVSKAGIDVPCDRVAKHSLKFISRQIGNKTKAKIPLCDYHYQQLLDRHTIEDLIQGSSDLGISEEYTAILIKGRT